MILAARHEPSGRAPGDAQRPGAPSSSAHFREFCPVDSWSPAINLYRLRQRVDVCVDLAGVEPKSIVLRIESSKLVIEGVRVAPQPAAEGDDVMCIESMEIDHGPFCRQVALPPHVRHARVQIQYAQGLLWVRIPIGKGK